VKRCRNLFMNIKRDYLPVRKKTHTQKKKKTSAEEKRKYK